VRELTQLLDTGTDLTDDAVERAAAALLSGETGDAEKADFLIALRKKGETAGEMAAFVRAFLDRAVDPALDPARLPGPMLDVCGTGGDQMHLFNISTTSIFVLAAGGAAVVKHGNRGITSKCGGADVLEALGIRIDLAPPELKRCVEETGLGFLFAPSYHPAFKAVAPVRRMLAGRGITSVFNLLGPLLNPARPARQLIGVFSKEMLPNFAHVLALLRRECAWAVNGSAGERGSIDELSTAGPTEIHKVRLGSVSAVETLLPEHAGLATASIDELRGGDCAVNAATLRGILDGGIVGPKREIVLLNAAAGFVIAGLAPDLVAGIHHAREAIDSGRALARLETLREFSAA
jgi:anthranilate phosphoribosyltransferase